METITNPVTDFSDIKDHRLLPNLNVLIGKYLNRYGYSDVNVIGKIISVRGNSFVTIKRIKAERDTSVKLDFHVGGFSAHCSNQHAQKWNFTETDETFEVRLSKGYLRSVRIQNEPHEFYDYNF